jgi:TIP41-like family
MYGGHVSASSDRFSWERADPENITHRIPMNELTRPDPILFYAEIPLFEDELHDNGSSDFLIRIVRLSSRVQCKDELFVSFVAGNAHLRIHSIAIDSAS